jgi:hypothetical protein
MMKIVLAISLATSMLLVVQVRMGCTGSQGRAVVSQPLKGSMAVQPSGHRASRDGYNGIPEHPVCAFYRTGAATVDGKW